MYDLGEKVSYLRGLIEGMGYKEDSNEGRIYLGIVDILQEMADAIAELETSQSELNEYVEALDEDLTDVEDEVFGTGGDDEDDEEGDYRYIEVECPHCHDTVYFDEEIFDEDDDIVCPTCNKVIYSSEADEEDDTEEDES